MIKPKFYSSHRVRSSIQSSPEIYKDDNDYLSVNFGKQKQSYLVSLAQGKVSEVAFESLSLKV